MLQYFQNPSPKLLELLQKLGLERELKKNSNPKGPTCLFWSFWSDLEPLSWKPQFWGILSIQRGHFLAKMDSKRSLRRGKALGKEQRKSSPATTAEVWHPKSSPRKNIPIPMKRKDEHLSTLHTFFLTWYLSFFRPNCSIFRDLIIRYPHFPTSWVVAKLMPHNIFTYSFTFCFYWSPQMAFGFELYLFQLLADSWLTTGFSNAVQLDSQINQTSFLEVTETFIMYIIC